MLTAALLPVYQVPLSIRRRGAITHLLSLAYF